MLAPRPDVSLLTLNIHDHGDVTAAVAIRRLAVVRPVAAPWHRYLQVENAAVHDGVQPGTFPKPTIGWLRLRSCVAGHRFRYRVHRHVDHFL